jgi:hypothetical protein
MQENEFEKKMQQKMEAFQLQPTEAVWQKLQLRVAKGKERKRKYIIFSFLLLAFLGSTLLVADLKQQTSSLNKREGNKIEKILSQADIVNKEQQQQLADKLAPAVSSFNNKHTYTKPQHNIAATNNKASYSKIRSTTKGSTKIKVTAAVVTEDQLGINENVVTEKERFPNTDRTVTSDLKPAVKSNEPRETTVKEQLQIQPTKENKDLIKATQPSIKKDKNKLLNTSFSLAIGRSSAGNKYPGGNATADYTNSTSGLPGGLGTYFPSATNPGLSLTAGFEVSRSLSAKTTLGAGLQYKLFTTSVATGEKENTQLASGSRQEIFRSGSSNLYTSFYHFITLPVSFSTQIATIKGREINLTGGVNFSRLIYTNALQFDNAQGNYYSDNTVFNKTQVGLSAAALINLAGKNKVPFYIGPDFYYSLTPQAASGIYAVSHYKSFGIRIQKRLQKK